MKKSLLNFVVGVSSERGIVYSIRAYQIPECSRTAAGNPLVQVWTFELCSSVLVHHRHNHNLVYVYMILFVELVILFGWLDYFGLNINLCVWICMPGLQCSVEDQVHGISLAEEIGWWASLGSFRIFNICRFSFLDNSVLLKMCQAFEMFIWVSGHTVFISKIFKCIWNSICLGWLTDPASATWGENHICAVC